MTTFAQLAEQQIVNPRARRLRQRAERAEKWQREKQQMHSAWRWHRAEQLEQLRAAHGERVDDLLAISRSAKLADAASIIAHIEEAEWLRSASADTRYTALNLIADAIAALREKNGLTPFDDALPFSDETPTAFQIIRELLL